MNFTGNWLDLVLILVLLFFALQAWEHDLWTTLAGLISFVGSLFVSLALFSYPARLLRDNFALSHGISNAIAFLAVAIISEAVLGSILMSLFSLLPKVIRKNPLAKLFAIIPGVGQGIVFVSAFLLLATAVPLRPSLREAINNSQISGYVIAQSSRLEARISEIFGEAIDESMTYITIKPQSHESVQLTVDSYELTVDQEAEEAMFTLVNKERKERGVGELTWDPQIVPVARAHAKDMWERKYFSHISPEGESVGDRLTKAGIEYGLAGENLALAPTLDTAHNGLMNSEGHRANILEPDFRKMGIGVIDNGTYGKMFVQVFTD